MINSNKNKLPKKHHYLPVFYLKGFTNSKRVFHVYDKIEDKIYPNSRPENFFCENNLNSYKINGETKFTLENTLFSLIDNDTAPILKKIISSDFKNENQITEIERMLILHFFVSLFWRLPDNGIHSEIIRKYGLLNDYLSASDKNTGNKMPPELVKSLNDSLINDTQATRLLKHIIPMSAGAEEVLELYEKWNFYPLSATNPVFVIGDNPFLINNQNLTINNVFNELIIPVSQKHLLVLSENGPKFIDSWMHFNVNRAIFHQSQRFIACSDLEYLNKLIIDCKKDIEIKFTDDPVKETFDYIKILSELKTQEEYFNFHAAIRIV